VKATIGSSSSHILPARSVRGVVFPTLFGANLVAFGTKVALSTNSGKKHINRANIRAQDLVYSYEERREWRQKTWSSTYKRCSGLDGSVERLDCPDGETDITPRF
jgi:hypothetical protein